MRLEVATEAVAFARANPDVHNQEIWRCGSTTCIAGIIAELGGARWRRPDDDEDTEMVTPDGRYLHVWDVAAEFLDVELDECEVAFDAGLTLDEVEETFYDLYEEGENR